MIDKENKKLLQQNKYTVCVYIHTQTMGSHNICLHHQCFRLPDTHLIANRQSALNKTSGEHVYLLTILYDIMFLKSLLVKSYNLIVTRITDN